jgi:hypothetical protein
MSRKPLSKKMRFEVFKRDVFCCKYCGSHPPDVILEVDHIIPVSDGGVNDIGNLVTSCFNCNRGKSNISLKVIPKSLAEQGDEIQEREAQLAGYRDIVQARLDRIEDDKWRVADAIITDSSTNGLRRDWLHSIKQFNDLLPLHEVLEAADIAWSRQPNSKEHRFRYFCGVCWNKIRQGTVDGKN